MAKFTYLFEIPSIVYMENMRDILRAYSKFSKRMCYVTFNKTAGFMQTIIAEEDLGIDVLYIDGITAAVFNPAPAGNTIYLKYPMDPGEFELAIDRMIDVERVDMFVFDSLSTLTAYERQDRLMLLFDRIMLRLTEKKIIGVFICLLEDAEKDLVTHIVMHCDQVQKYEGK